MNIEIVKKIVRDTDSIFFNDEFRADVTKKGDSDFVTKADLAISDFVKGRLKEEFPEIGFISEEEDFHFSEGKDYWILDPIDGTSNFMYNCGFSCVSLGYYSKGDFAAGIIYNPYNKEMFWAEKGKGAFLNDTPIHCNATESLSDCLGVMIYNAYYKDEIDIAMSQARKMFSACLDLRTIGSAALELAYLACGRVDVFLGRYLKPWDYAAAAVIIREAGGKITTMNGELDASVYKNHIVAGNSVVFDSFTKLLKEE